MASSLESCSPSDSPKKPGDRRDSLAKATRKMAFVTIGLTALNSLACGDDDCVDCCTDPIQTQFDAGQEADAAKEAEPLGYGCVSVLGQKNQQMNDCTFAYKLPKEGKELADCLPGQLFLYGPPKTYTIQAECGDSVWGKLHGTVRADIEEGTNEPQETRLNGSLCYRDAENIVTDPYHPITRLGDFLGRNDETDCSNKFTDAELRQIDIVDRTLDCTTVEGDCDPTSGRDYLIQKYQNGDYSDGHPIHLNLTANTGLVPAGKEVTVIVTLLEKTGYQQAIEIPVVIRGAKDDQ